MSNEEVITLASRPSDRLEIECSNQEEPASLPFLDRMLRSKGICLFSGAVLLVAWWFAYDNLLSFSRFITYHILGFRQDTRLGATVEFFIFEVPKVLLLLTLVVFCVGIIRTFFTPERTRRILAGNRESVGHVLAALLGVVTPFCSCSAVPLFMGFLTAGVPLGVTFSFLVSAPMVNEVALVLLFGLFGWKVAGLYMGTGLFIALVTGFVISRLRMEKHLEDWVLELTSARPETTQPAVEEDPMVWDGPCALRNRCGQGDRCKGLAVCDGRNCCGRGNPRLCPREFSRGDYG